MLGSFDILAIDYYWDTTNPPGNVQWTEGTVVNISDILNLNDPLSTTQLLDNAGTIEINNSVNFTINGDVASAGVINTNTGTLTFPSTTVNNGNSINNGLGGTIDFTAISDVTTGDISNSGHINLDGTINIGTLTNNVDGTMTFGSSISFNGNFTNDGTVAPTNSFFVSNTLSNTGTLTANTNINATDFRNEVGGVLEFATGASTFTQIINEGTFNVTGSSTSTQRVDSSGIMNVDADFGGGGPSLHNTGTLNLNSGGSVQTTIFNDAGTTFCNGGSSGGLQNFDTVQINQPLTFTNNDLQNYAILNMNNNVVDSFIVNNGGGTINVSGNRSIVNGGLTSIGIMNFTITNSTTNDSLTTDLDIDISDSTVEITSSFSGPAGSSYDWDILTSNTTLITNGGTLINIPTSTAFEIWSQDIISNAILRVSYINNNTPAPPPSVTPEPGIDAEIAAVLAAMKANITNSGQAELIAAVDGVTTQSLYNYLLSNLQPSTNNSASNTTLAMQNIGFSKIEARVASTGKQKKQTVGIASGDITKNTAVWLAGLGSLSKQNPHNENQGYRARVLGGMLGFDSRTRREDVYGIAFGVSNANVYGIENSTFTTRILAYNLMIYGANNFKNNFFAEWLASGVTTKNSGVRVFGVNGIDLSTNASYRSALGGIRVNFGKEFKFDEIFNLSQVNRIQYVLVHQPDYNEGGSVAALHVATKENQSILTLGTGFRFDMIKNDSWSNGNRELRAMVTYDAISPDQATTANFIVGSNSFIMTSSPARWALQLGADYGFMLYKKLNLQLSYDFEVRSNYYDNFGEVKLRYVF
jgi:uncharacterized protein with beta-barrel porin domain